MHHGLLASAAILLVLFGCRRDEPSAVERQAERQAAEHQTPSPLGEPGQLAVEPEAGPKISVQRATAEKLWPELAGYRDWAAHTDAPVRGEHPQGDYVHLFYNETAKAAIGGAGEWPNDTIFVKDNFPIAQAGEGPGELTSITVMKKGAGVWFWAQYRPDGSLVEMPDGTVVAGTADIDCVDCHMSAARRDHVITNLDRGE